MKKKIKPKLLIDTREKTPFNFDGDSDFSAIEYCKIDAGDYTIDGLQGVVAVERKASADELLNNFLENKQRIYAEFARMDGYKLKVIVIEQDLETIMTPNSYYINRAHKNKASPYMPPAVVLSNLIDLMLQHGVQIIFAGSKAANITKKILLRAHELHEKGQL